MIVDSSALVAIINNEPERSAFLDKIQNAPVRRMSAASLLETCIVVQRLRGAESFALIQSLIEDLSIEIADFTATQARLAFSAHQRFGKGTGHAAKLNILDCCAYALAAEHGEPILFKGDDFNKTDALIPS